MLRSSRSAETLEKYAHVRTLEVMGDFAAVLGIAAVVYQKAKAAQAARARTSLSALSGLQHLPFRYDYAECPPFDEPSGLCVKGHDALTHLYETASDRSLLLSALKHDVPRLPDVEPLEGIAYVPLKTEPPSKAIRKVSAEKSSSRSNAAEIGASICDSTAAIRSANSSPADDTLGIDRGSYSFSIFGAHPSGLAVTQVDLYAIIIRGAAAPAWSLINA
ncbi:hypothetical protein ACVIIV_003226 [Bradyrhizobium sp. USDA 4354]